MKIQRLNLFITALSILFCANSFAQQSNTNTDTSKYKPVVYPSDFTSSLNEVYTVVNGWEGKMDVYYKSQANQPTPIIINIHGGGWKNGVKESQGGFTSFFKEEMAVANIEYRMTPQATAPAAIEDARCALIYLIKNAKKFNIDINKIVVMGGSAGGHLALMTGMLGNNHLFDSNCPGVEKINVAAIIDKYGITDVWDWAYTDHGPAVKKSGSPRDWLGNKKNDEAFAKSVSPVSYLSKSNPPVLIIHGNADSTVPYKQSQDLFSKLKELGVKTELITVDGGGHGKFTKEKNAELSKSIIAFIKSLDVFKQ
jgi:acetyl esterase/lipase